MFMYTISTRNNASIKFSIISGGKVNLIGALEIIKLKIPSIFEKRQKTGKYNTRSTISCHNSK